MNLTLTELTHPAEISEMYEIYKHCMFLPTREKFQSKMLTFLKDPSVQIFACLSGGQPLGMIVISLRSELSAEIIGIAVEESARNQGIGSFMIAWAAENHRTLFAETDADAVEFYRKNRFSVTETAKIFDGEEVVRFQCKREESSCSD